MKNTDLKPKYDKMHSKGPESWFDDGSIERQNIVNIGKPWKNLKVLEIGCGEGDLLNMIYADGGNVTGIDYSAEAIKSATGRYPHLDNLFCMDYHDFSPHVFDVIVMQGVMEHMDQPFEELEAIIAKYLPKTVITSMPAFINPRGLVWMALDLVGAVMSKTDLHFIHPWEVEGFCQNKRYRLSIQGIDKDWAAGGKMIDDLTQRLPLAMKDGGLKFRRRKLHAFLRYLEQAGQRIPYTHENGAVIVYRIDL